MYSLVSVCLEIGLVYSSEKLVPIYRTAVAWFQLTLKLRQCGLRNVGTSIPDYAVP